VPRIGTIELGIPEPAESLAISKAWGYASPERKFQKITGPRLDTIAGFRSLQIPAPYFAPTLRSIFGPIFNRTKMFDVKHFGTIRTLIQTVS
jgi:hypothetical protein